MVENSPFLASFTDKKTSQKCNKNDLLRNEIVFLIRVENSDCSLSQVKLTESGGKFTVSGKFYWQKTS